MTITALLLGLALGARTSPGADPMNRIELPVDGNTVVLELAYQDAGRRAPRTVVRVYADGTVAVADPDGGGELRSRMTPAQLAGLLKELVEEASLFELDTHRIQRDVQAAAAESGRPWRISDPGLMVIRIRLRDRRHEVRCPSAEIWHERFPEVPSVARLCRVRRRLENVRAVVQVGGWDRADELSKQANRELLRGHPQASPVTAADLSMVRGRLPEGRFVQFVSGPPDAGGRALLVSIIEFPDQPQRITVAPLPESSQ